MVLYQQETSSRGIATRQYWAGCFRRKTVNSASPVKEASSMRGGCYERSPNRMLRTPTNRSLQEPGWQGTCTTASTSNVSCGIRLHSYWKETLCLWATAECHTTQWW